MDGTVKRGRDEEDLPDVASPLKAFASVAEAELGEESLATAAFTRDCIFIRGKEYVY